MDAEKLAQEVLEKKKLQEQQRRKKRYTFRIEYEGGEGKLVGTFTNQILTFNDRLQVGNLAARLRGGVSVASLDPDTLEISQMMAWLMVSIRKKDDRPDWAEDFGELYDPALLRAIYQEVQEHEAIFRRPRDDQGGGQGEG